jgi:putative DNA primase/helicase
VRDAIEHYKGSNDWLSYFLSERCELDHAYVAKSSEVYNEYRIFCAQVGEFTRSTTDFYTALESIGFERFRDRKGRYIKGLKLKSDFIEED